MLRDVVERKKLFWKKKNYGWGSRGMRWTPIRSSKSSPKLKAVESAWTKMYGATQNEFSTDTNRLRKQVINCKMEQYLLKKTWVDPSPLKTEPSTTERSELRKLPGSRNTQLRKIPYPWTICHWISAALWTRTFWVSSAHPVIELNYWDYPVPLTTDVSCVCRGQTGRKRKLSF